MKLTKQINEAIDRVKNAGFTGFSGTGDEVNGRDFLRYGAQKPLIQDWSKVKMSDREFYSGYGYSAINNRRNRVAALAKDNIKTRASKAVQEQAKKEEKEIIHPYLELIDKSRGFTNTQFWGRISRYLDLKGDYYLLVIRTVGTGKQAGRLGNIQEFKMLNPYNIRRILDPDTLEVAGYVESKGGMVREIPVEMIIPMREEDPVDDTQTYTLKHAAREAQFTMKQAGDYTRHSLKGNMAAPGILSSDVILSPEEFANFKNRILKQEKGIPLFGNGSGAITYTNMQIDLDKAGLGTINENNRQVLMAVSGVSKTMMSIEESGTTRDVAKTQKDSFTENHAIPQLTTIIDALNQDYKNSYPKEYESTEYEMYIDNPLGSDREAEMKDVEISEKRFNLVQTLVGKGYEYEVAARYASGEITLEELGEPTIEAEEEEVEEDPIEPIEEEEEEEEEEPTAVNSHEHHAHGFKLDLNALDDQTQGLVATQQAALQNSVVNIEGRVVNAVLNKVTKNAFDEESDIIGKGQRKEYETELVVALAAFYATIMPIFGKANMDGNLKNYPELATVFTFNAEMRKYTKDISKLVAHSHMDTILNDLLKTTQEAYKEAVDAEIDKIKATGRSVTDEDLVFARKKALEGASQQQMVAAIKEKYTYITDVRAKAVARTETNRAFTQSQYYSDAQFIRQNNLEGRAYKQWVTRSNNPCAICMDLAASPPIPFFENFADLGETLSAVYEEGGKTKVLSQAVNFEPLESGNAHVNCGCRYVLIIQEA